MAERFSAFSFVDRIAQVEPGVRAVGRYAIPGDLRRFPSALVAEAIGQLAAWAGMAKLGFRRRPVAGLAGEIAYLGVASPGDLLELAVEIETCDEDAIAYGGAARVNSVPLLELKHCVGPMLAMEDFDAPEAVRADFEVLCAMGAPGGRFRLLPEPAVEVLERTPGRALRAVLRVPESAPFFGDHFPRRPVFPGTLLLHSEVELALELAREGAHGTPPFHPARVTDVKMRSFILPGQTVELRIELQPERAGAVTASLAARIEGKTVSTARVEIAPGSSA